MHDSKMRDQGVVHVLPKEGCRIEGVKRDSIRPAMRMPCQQSQGIQTSCCTDLGGHTASLDPVVTSWVTLHRYEERVADMFRRLWF